MEENFPNVDEMDIEEFEDFITKKKSKRRRSRSRTPETRIVKRVSPKRIEMDDLEKRLEVAKKQAEEAQRDDCTVLVLRLHIKADERDVYEFFNKAGVGKVRDVRIIKDQRTGRSKGVAYVEFYTPDAVLKSMALSGQMINGQSIMVQPSQAERNRAAAAAKMAKAAEQQLAMPTEGPNKIYIAGLGDQINNLGARELRRLFSSFGEIESVEINRGVGYVQYKRSKDAREAVVKMDGISIRGKKIRVSMADSKASIREAQRIGDHEEDGTYLRSRSSKMQLMQNLAKNTDLGGALPPGAASEVPTNVLLLTNLWKPSEVDLINNPEFFNDIHNDVRDEVRKYGNVDKVFVERNSQGGNVWVKFEDISSAKKAQMVLHRRYFNHRQIMAVFVTEGTMAAHMH
jgi:RNA-binding protein 39